MEGGRGEIVHQHLLLTRSGADGHLGLMVAKEKPNGTMGEMAPVCRVARKGDI